MAALMEFSRGEGIHLDLGKVADDPGPYTMSYGFSLDVLCESISRVGLINPPLVAQNQEGSFDIVTGYRRVLALKTLGEREAVCKDVTAALASPLERFLTAFYDNLATRKFNDIEKAMVLEAFLRMEAEKEVLHSYMPILSLPSHQGTLKFYLKLLGLSDSLKKAISREEVSIKAVKALLELEQSSQQALFRVMKALKLNFNQQMKLTEYSKDISTRENITVTELLHADYFRQFLENQQMNNPQKAKAMLDALKSRRFPRLTKAHSAAERAVSAVFLPPDTSVHYDPFLEDPYYRLEIRFRNGQELKNTISKLHALDQLEAIPELWATE